MKSFRPRAAARAFFVAASVAACSFTASAQVSANAYDRPFSRTASPWNLPVGSGATLVPANFGTMGAVVPDYEFLARSSILNPGRPVYLPRTTSTTFFSLRFPPGFVTRTPNVGDAGATPNNATNFVALDGKQLISSNGLYYSTSASKWFGYYVGPTSNSSLYSIGVSGFTCAHTGSGLPVIGGSIRPGELTANPATPDTIRHAISIELDWDLLYRNNNNAANRYQTYRWPASTSDQLSNASGPAYSGTIPSLRMGSLLVIRKTDSLGNPITADSLGITTAAGKKLLWTLQNFGGYVVDTSGNGYISNGGFVFNVGVQGSVPAEFQNTYGYTFKNYGRTNAWGQDMNKLYRALYVVSNNAQTTIGGGGTRPAGVAPAPLNLVTNPDFDQDQGITQSVATWTSVGSTAADRTSTSVTAHSGDYYLAHNDPSASIDIITRQNFTGLAPGTYRASVWVQSSGNHTDARLYVSVKQADGSFVNAPSAAVPSGLISNWTKITTAPFTVANGEAGIRLKTVTGAGSYVRWDDAEFYKE